MPHRDWVPYEDEELEVWSLNRGYIFQDRSDMHWEMHGRQVWEWQQRRPGNHVRWLQAFPGPVVMHERVAMFPNSVEYPFEEVAEDIGHEIVRFAPQGMDPKIVGTNRPQASAPYLASTIAQQLALAIHMGYKEIALYGIDLNTTAEYAWQKPGVEHMLGLAAGRGIKIGIPDMCPLLKGGIYGRGYKRPEGEIVSADQWQERINALMDQCKGLEAELNVALGAQKECDYLMKQMLPGIDHEAVDQRQKKLTQAAQHHQIQLIQAQGALNETLYWAHQTADGQPADEAIRQLQLARLTEAGLSEGPEEGTVETMVMDVPSSGSVPVYSFSANGAQPVEAVAV